MHHVWNSKQVIPVSMNESSQLYHTIITNSGSEREFLTYASGKIIVILSSELEVVQIIESFAEVNDLAWCEPDGQLAVGVASCVVIYQLSLEMGQFTWKEKYKLEHDFIVQAVSWSPDQGYVLAGGTSLVVWDLYPTSVIPPKPTKHADTPLHSPSVITFVSVSPDSRLFISFCEEDRTPKVWYKNKKGFGNFYLPHPRTVHSVSWRKQYSGLGDWKNVLLTTCVDGEVRFWVESDFNERLQFTLLHTISAGTETIVDWLSGFEGNQTRPIYNITQEATEFHHIHTIDKDRYNTNIIKEISCHDWVIGIEADGSVIIWDISDLFHPIPTINKYKYLKHVFAASKRKALIGVVQRFLVKEQGMYPSLISVYVSSIRGDIASWNFHIGDGNENNVEPKLRYHSFGHRNKISDLSRHQHLPLVASLDKDGNVIAWRVSDTSLSDSSQVLLDLCYLSSPEQEPGKTLFLSSAKKSQKSSTTSSVISDSEEQTITEEEEKSEDVETKVFTNIVWDDSHPVLYALHPEKGIYPFLIPYEPATGDGFETHVVGLDVTPYLLSEKPFGLSNFSEDSPIAKLHILPNIYFEYLSKNSKKVREIYTKPDTSFVLGIDAKGLTLQIWKVTKDLTNRTINSILLMTKKIDDPDAAITCATIPIALHHDDGLSPLLTHCSLITGGKDGCVRIWRLLGKNIDEFDGTWKLKQLCRINTSSVSDGQSEKRTSVQVISVAASYFGRIATFLRGQKNDSIQIWEFVSSAPQFRLEDVIQLTSELDVMESHTSDTSRIGLLSPLLSKGRLGRSTVENNSETNRSIKDEKGTLSMDWLVLTEGSELLALTRGRQCSVYSKTQPLSTIQQTRSEWAEIMTNNIPLPFPSHCAIWIHRGSLLVATNNHLNIFTKWVQCHSHVFTPEPTLFLEVTSKNRPHPFYHPTVLVELMEGGQFDRMGLILRHLYVELNDFKKKVAIEEKLKISKGKNKGSTKKRGTDAQKHIPLISAIPIRRVLHDILATIETEESQKSEKIPETNQKNGDEDEEDFRDQKQVTDTKKTKSDSDSESSDDIIYQKKTKAVDDTHKYDFLGHDYDDFGFDSIKKEDVDDDDVEISGFSDVSDSDEDSNDKKKKKKKEEEKKNKKDIENQKSDEEENPVTTTDQLSELEKVENKFKSSTSIFAESNLITQEQCLELAEMLQQWPLPGVSSKEQVYLLAIVETLSTMLQEGKGLVDKCGVKFVLMTRIFNFMCKSVPPNQRPKQLSWLEISWALHADTHEVLVKQILPEEPLWPSVRALGIPLWVCDHPTLVSVADILAKTHYMQTKNPADCALFYTAMGKLSPLARLFKVAKEEAIEKFLSYDFNQKRFRDAATTNAYRLMSQHKFEMAATFFILGGALKKSVEICIEKLDDFQLALLVARLVENGQEGPVYRWILSDKILPLAIAQKENELASIALWLLKEYKQSVESLVPAVKVTTFYNKAEEVEEKEILKDKSGTSDGNETESNIGDYFKPGTFHLFEFLCQTRLIRNRNLTFSHLEKNLFRKTYYAYNSSGCTALAIEQRLLQDYREHRNQQETAQKGNKFSIASLLGKGKTVQKQVVTEEDAEDLTNSLDREALFRSAVTFLSRHLMDMQVRALMLGARAIVARTIKHTEDEFRILQEDWDLLVHYLKINPNDILHALIEFCSSNGYLREQYLILRHVGRYKEAGDLLAAGAHRITLAALRSLESLSRGNSLTTTQARQLEVASRHLYACLIEFTNPRVFQTENEEDEEKDVGTLETIEKPDLEVGPSQGVTTPEKPTEQPPQTIFPKKQPLLQAPLASSIPELSMNSQIMVIAAGRVGVFAAAWSQHDYLTLFELSEGKHIDQLTKEQVSPWVWDEDNANEDIGNEEAKSDISPTTLSTSQDMVATLMLESRKRLQQEDQEHIDLVNSVKDYLLDLLLLLIRFQFISMLDQFLKINMSFVDSEAKAIISHLRQIQVQLENSLRHLPEEILQLYSRYIERNNKDLKKSRSKTHPPGDDVEQKFFQSLIKEVSLFSSSSQITKDNHGSSHDNIHTVSEPDVAKCQELARDLLEEQVVLQYLDKLGFIKYSKFYKNIPSTKVPEPDTNKETRDEFDDEKPGNIPFIQSIDTPLHIKPPKFDPFEMLYHHKEMILSFAINPVEPTIFVIGTHSGLTEIDLHQNVTRELISSAHTPTPPISTTVSTPSIPSIPHSPTSIVSTPPSSPTHTVTNIPLLAMSNLPGNHNSSPNIPPLPSPGKEALMSPSSQNGLSTSGHTPNRHSLRLPRLRSSDSESPRKKGHALDLIKKDSSGSDLGKISTRVLSGVRDSSQQLRSSNPMLASVGGGRQMTIQTLCSHPHLPFYLSGGVDGSIILWKFKFPNQMTHYRNPGTPRIHHIRFSSTGSKFGACDNSGKVSLWRWSSQDESRTPYRILQCHSGRCSDMAFLNLGSSFVTTGNSAHNSEKTENVCFWDSLLPDSKANVWSCLTHLEGGTSSLAYSPRHQAVFVGSKKGSIAIIDIRQHQVMAVIEKAHEMNVRSLSVDPQHHYMVSGSTDGCVKLWDLSSSVLYHDAPDPLPLLHTEQDVHKQHTFVRPLSPGVLSTYGVTQVQVKDSGHYSCGSDGKILFRPSFY